MTQTGDEKKESYRKMLEIMGCPCQVIDRRGAEQPLEELYLEKREQGKRDGFVPLFIYPDENFIDMVTTNLAESSMEMPESLLGRFEDGEAAEHFQEDTDYLTRQNQMSYWRRFRWTSPGRCWAGFPLADGTSVRTAAECWHLQNGGMKCGELCRLLWVPIPCSFMWIHRWQTRNRPRSWLWNSSASALRRRS